MTKALAISLVLISSAFAQKGPDHWVATWTTPQPTIRAVAANPQAPAARGFNNQTVRMIVRTSIGGRRMRLRFASPFGATPVVIGETHVALSAKGSAIAPGSDRAVSFNGKPSLTIGPGMVVLSDPLDFDVPALGDLAVSIYLPGDTGPPSAHNGLHTSYASKEGNQAAAVDLPEPAKMPAYYWLEAVDVMAPAATSLIVTFGDSITEGARSTPDTNSPWPSVLAARLAANKSTANWAVANMGIGGNRVLRDVSGASALARFDRDVLSQPGVKWVLLLEGINDIGRSNIDPATAADLIGAYKQMIERAHMHGIKVMGCTLTPYEGANYARPEGEAIRTEVNNWIRTSGAFDAVTDFEAATRDSANPKRIRADFDPGDHLHPNDAGYKAMGEAIDLRVFAGKAGK